MVVDIATLTEQGDRNTQQDAVCAYWNADGSWVLAIADGTGGGQKPDAVAPAAINAIPQRIASKNAMTAAFLAANKAARALTAAACLQPLHEDLPGGWGVESQTTLSVAAWTPEGGLLSAWVGDSMTFIVPLKPGEGWHSSPQRITYGSRLVGEFAVLDDRASSILTQTMQWMSYVIPRPEADNYITEGCIVAVVSDGAYNGYMGRSRGTWFSDYPKDNSLGFVLKTKGRLTAQAAAEAIMRRARRSGLHDNTTIAVVRVSATI